MDNAKGLGNDPITRFANTKKIDHLKYVDGFRDKSTHPTKGISDFKLAVLKNKIK